MIIWLKTIYIKRICNINNHLIIIKISVIKIISQEIKYKNEAIKTSFFTLKTTGFNYNTGRYNITQSEKKKAIHFPFQYFHQLYYHH